jgi:hypothetical protein
MRPQHLRDSLRQLREQRRDLLVARRLLLHEPRPIVSTGTVGHEHAVGYQHVEVQA